jgi:hypothetical protein
MDLEEKTEGFFSGLIKKKWFRKVALPVTAASSFFLGNGEAESNVDFDRNGKVEFSDFIEFASHFNTKRGDDDWDAKYDVDGNGVVGFSDFLMFSKGFGRNIWERTKSRVSNDLGNVHFENSFSGININFGFRDVSENAIKNVAVSLIEDETYGVLFAQHSDFLPHIQFLNPKRLSDFSEAIVKLYRYSDDNRKFMQRFKDKEDVELISRFEDDFGVITSKSFAGTMGKRDRLPYEETSAAIYSITTNLGEVLNTSLPPGTFTGLVDLGNKHFNPDLFSDADSFYVYKIDIENTRLAEGLGHRKTSYIKFVPMERSSEEDKLFNGTIFYLEGYNRVNRTKILHFNGEISEIEDVERSQDISISPDGTQIAYTNINIPDKRENLWIMDINGENKQKISDLDVRSLDFGVNGLLALEVFPGSICIMSSDGSYHEKVRSHQSRYDNKGKDETFHFPQWSDDGSGIYFVKRVYDVSISPAKYTVSIRSFSLEENNEVELFSPVDPNIAFRRDLRLDSVHGNSLIYTMLNNYVNQSDWGWESWILNTEDKSRSLVFDRGKSDFFSTDATFIDNGRRIFYFNSPGSYVIRVSDRSREDIEVPEGFYRGDWTPYEY